MPLTQVTEGQLIKAKSIKCLALGAKDILKFYYGFDLISSNALTKFKQPQNSHNYDFLATYLIQAEC